MPDAENRSRARRAELRVLGIASLWMLLSMAAALLAWNAGVATRVSSLVHWLILGVMPAAMALWLSPPPAETSAGKR